MKILILGYARSGKDTAAEYWKKQFGLTFESSSIAACNEFVFKKLNSDKQRYINPRECFEDRQNHRQEWFDLIKDYNKDDGARLAKLILENSDCYVGMRNILELRVCKEQNLFDFIIWIDAEERVGKETGSCDIDKSVADIIINNNSTEEEFKEKLNRLGKIITTTWINKII